MKKETIMEMKESGSIMKALAENRDIWDADLFLHLKKVKQEENRIRFGNADVIYTPPEKEKYQ